MLTEYVIPGDKIELTEVRSEESDENGNIERKVYRTRIYDVVSEDEIKVTMPIEKGKLVLLPVDGEFDLCFYTSNGLYQCFSRVSDRYKSNNVYILCLELTSNLRKFQRREYYRLNCVLNMKCHLLNDNEYDQITREVQFIDTDLTLQDGIIVDISGGGARFISKEAYEHDTKILFVFSLTTGKEPVKYSIIGRILLSNEIEGREGEYENRVQFINMNTDDREGIIRFIFEEERKIRRRERNDL